MSAQNPTIVDSPEWLYRQLPLGALEIRLLRLEPRGGPSAEIRASLIKYNLQERPTEITSFQALSYTWGNSSITNNIIINGVKLPVADNLYSFLLHRQETNQGIDLWVDAICINQDDLLEKNHQIPMMNMIYMRASELIIWLGPPSFDSELAIQSILEMGSGSPYDKLITVENDVWQAIQSLLERPWWKRIWIVQELTMGAMGIKLGNAAIQCGRAHVLWTNVVIAAARMKAHQDDQRQIFPAITDILELDSLRDTAGHFFLKPSSQAWFDLVCRYRSFQASNKRDKIYAIWNMFNVLPSNRLETRYDESVAKVYTDFAAMLLLGESKLEILRQCGNGDQDLPSWVPDWSASLGSQLLPLRNIQRYFDVPWWAEPVYAEPKKPMRADGSGERSSVTFRGNAPPMTLEDEVLRQRRIKRLEMAALGSAVIKDLEDVPANFAFHQMSPDKKDQLRELLQREDFILVVAHENPHLPEEPDALQQGELITEREMKRWLLQELKHSNSEPLYATATSVDASFKIDKSERTLQIKGILWDELEICHESFAEDVDKNWTDATRFMVAVGCCKHLAMSNNKASVRYLTINQLLEAFWSTLFVGQATGKQEPRYEDWLPEISKSWSPGQPPMAAKTAGLVELAEMCETLDQSLSNINTGAEDCDSKIDSKLDPQLKERAFPQHDDAYVALLRQLASTWQEQPYDLYHRPFHLVNMVPDPYWECRRHSDELAKRQATARRVNHITSDVNGNNPEDVDHSARKLVHQAMDATDKALRQQPSLVPQDTLKAGIEKFALGRRFFITKKGYFGLGPQKLEPGDRVAVLFGSGVPFVLRKCPASAGRRAWRIIGECYVHGIMQGEVIQKWELGTSEAQMLLLLMEHRVLSSSLIAFKELPFWTSQDLIPTILAMALWRYRLMAPVYLLVTWIDSGDPYRWDRIDDQGQNPCNVGLLDNGYKYTLQGCNGSSLWLNKEDGSFNSNCRHADTNLSCNVHRIYICS
ncbi:hypothetical protein MKX08_004569 [Trichoderma sp. CBMAI-0020]|nr:hypothetical protein MKX08_004569 [Trichoderma sp. CBMAI-0020]